MVTAIDGRRGRTDDRLDVPLTAGGRGGVNASVVWRAVRRTVACPTTADIDKEEADDG